MLFPMEEQEGIGVSRVRYVRRVARVFVVVGVLLCVGAVTYGVRTWTDHFVENSTVVGEPAPDFTVWVGDQELDARVLRLDQASGVKLEKPAAGGTFFVVLPTSGVPRITFLNHPVDLWWLNAAYTTVGTEYGTVPDPSAPLTVPGGAAFLLIAPTGVLPPNAGVTVHTVRVSDERALR